MANGADGRFSKEEISTIRAAHQEWCQARSIEPESKEGFDAATAMIAMFQSGKIWKHELMTYRSNIDSALQRDRKLLVWTESGMEPATASRHLW